MTRLLVITNLFHPDCGGGAAIFSDLCYALAEKGIDVVVQCAYPYYPEWKDKSGRNGWKICRHEERCDEASFLLSLLRSLPRGRKDFDVIMVYCPLVGAVAYASFRKLLHSTPVWLNVQDLSAEAAEAAGISKSGSINRLLRRVQGFFFNQADVWSTISPVMAERLKSVSKRNQPILYLPNWVNASLIEQIDALPKKVGQSISHPVKLLYSGNIGKKQDLLRFCKAMHQSDALFEFRIHGDGGEAEKIRQWIRQRKDERFIHRPFLDESGFARALHHADLFVITEKHGSGGSFIPSKLIPGIRSGTPILAICDDTSPLGQEMERIKPGPRFSWSQLPQMTDLISTLPENTDYPTWQRNAVARSAFYDRDNIISQFEAMLQNISRRHTQTYADRK